MEEISISQKVGRCESIFLVCLLCLVLLGLVLPSPDGELAPFARHIGEDHIALSWESPRRCPRRCWFQVFMKRIEKDEDWQPWGEVVEYSSLFISYKVEGLDSDEEYRFKVRHSSDERVLQVQSPSSDSSDSSDSSESTEQFWEVFSPESWTIRTKTTQRVAEEKVHANSRSKSGKQKRRDSARLTEIWRSLKTSAVQSAQLSTASLLVTFLVFLFKSDSISYILASLRFALSQSALKTSIGLAVLGTAVYVFEPLLSGIGGNTMHQVLGVLEQSFFIVGAIVLGIGAVLLVNLLWWRCQRFNWGLINNGGSFFAVIAFFSAAFVHIIVQKVRLFQFLNASTASLTVPLTVYFVWMVLMWLLIGIAIAIEKVFLPVHKLVLATSDSKRRSVGPLFNRQ